MRQSEWEELLKRLKAGDRSSRCSMRLRLWEEDGEAPLASQVLPGLYAALYPTEAQPTDPASVKFLALADGATDTIGHGETVDVFGRPAIGGAVLIESRGVRIWSAEPARPPSPFTPKLSGDRLELGDPRHPIRTIAAISLIGAPMLFIIGFLLSDWPIGTLLLLALVGPALVFLRLSLTYSAGKSIREFGRKHWGT